MWMILKWALFICDFMEDFSSGAVHLQIEEIQPLLSMIPDSTDWLHGEPRLFYSRWSDLFQNQRMRFQNLSIDYQSYIDLDLLKLW